MWTTLFFRRYTTNFLEIPPASSKIGKRAMIVKHHHRLCPTISRIEWRIKRKRFTAFCSCKFSVDCCCCCCCSGYRQLICLCDRLDCRIQFMRSAEKSSKYASIERKSIPWQSHTVISRISTVQNSSPQTCTSMTEFACGCFDSVRL